MRWFLSLIGNLIALTAAFGLLARYVPPQVFWPPAIIALLLPGLLVLTAIYALFALSRRHWAGAVLPIAVILFSIPVLDQLFAWPGNDEGDGVAGPTVTFVTGNQRLFRYADVRNADREMVAEKLGGYGSDVLLLQEVRPPNHRTDYDQTIQKGSQLPDRHQEEKTLIATYAQDITPLASAFTEPDRDNGYIVSDVKTSLGTIRVINVHLESNKISGMVDNIQKGEITNQLKTAARIFKGYGRTTTRRAQQAEEIREFIETSPHPVVLGGDFNDVPSSYTYNQILSPRLKDAWVARGRGLGTTFTGPLPGLRIDYFLVDTSLSVVSIERLSPNWSDHRPLRMVVGKPAGATGE